MQYETDQMHEKHKNRQRNADYLSVENDITCKLSGDTTV
jgi:hypothetical protein